MGELRQIRKPKIWYIIRDSDNSLNPLKICTWAYTIVSAFLALADRRTQAVSTRFYLPNLTFSVLFLLCFFHTETIVYEATNGVARWPRLINE